MLINIFLFKDSGSVISAKEIGIPTRSIFEDEIMKPIYDTEIMVYAIEQRLIH